MYFHLVDNIVSLIQGFTIELNPKVRFKINSIPLDSKNHIYITYLPDASENDILETVEFVSSQKLIPIVHLPDGHSLIGTKAFASTPDQKTIPVKIAKPIFYDEKNERLVS